MQVNVAKKIAARDRKRGLGSCKYSYIVHRRNMTSTKKLLSINDIITCLSMVFLAPESNERLTG